MGDVLKKIIRIIIIIIIITLPDPFLYSGRKSTELLNLSPPAAMHVRMGLKIICIEPHCIS